jgi:hypothetical protein
LLVSTLRTTAFLRTHRLSPALPATVHFRKSAGQRGAKRSHAHRDRTHHRTITARLLAALAREATSPASRRTATMTATRNRTTGKKKYSDKAGEKVHRAMRELNEGTLRSGRSGRKVTSREQAIAIGLSEARREGARLPRNKKSASS